VASNPAVTRTARWIAAFLSGFILLAAWAVTLDGFFVAPAILRWTDHERAETAATEHAASYENVSIRASDGVVLKGWLFTPKAGRVVRYCLSMQAWATAMTC
jgi:hypothetical protein